ncbi:hypothetical protein K9N68_33535 [Kovacikia minuta CCNUW1]|uniref:hypothetical protein n=1 Tax=Kovacikia minuta TaxID=2931930 RepID=UPI001CC917E8|nr:hypothetical protein [Kovacikia minuta]UBF26368.1 hypothetical protein K9N68_33535 [Kovacikia minuta CCNUW1]
MSASGDLGRYAHYEAIARLLDLLATLDNIFVPSAIAPHSMPQALKLLQTALG